MIYRLVFNLVLRRIPAEAAHALAIWSLRALTAIPGVQTLLRKLLQPTDRRLALDALGLTFPSPVGVAGGLDKQVLWFKSLGCLGFGFVEVGTVTAEPQHGNPRPRVFRLPRDKALLNSMGFPNPGAAVAAERLRNRSGSPIIGVNLGKSESAPLDQAGADYRASTARVAPYADFLVLNISSPNTPGLRDLQAVEPLRVLVADVRSQLRELNLTVPILLKLGPDLSDDRVLAIADLAVELELEGIVAVNTTASREGLKSARALLERPGGISGAPLKSRALEVLQLLHAHAAGRLVLISVGGIETPDDAWERILAGATLVQAHTGFIYGGPFWAHRINRGLLAHLDKTNFPSLQEAVGAGSGPPPKFHGEFAPRNGDLPSDEPDALAAAAATLVGRTASSD